MFREQKYLPFWEQNYFVRVRHVGEVAGPLEAPVWEVSLPGVPLVRVRCVVGLGLEADNQKWPKICLACSDLSKTIRRIVVASQADDLLGSYLPKSVPRQSEWVCFIQPPSEDIMALWQSMTEG